MKKKTNKNYNEYNKKKKKTKKRQTGGTKIGKGGYSCVITPAIKCNKSDNIKGKISKIMETHKVSKYNHILNKKIKTIDPEQKHLIYYNKYCKLKLNDIKNRKHKDIEIINNNNNSILSNLIENFNCIIEKDKKYINIIENYGGKTLNEYIQKNKLNFDLGKNLIKDLLYGLKLMHDNKIVHRDVKIDNIVYNNKNFKYIDFNISLDLETYDKPNKISLGGNINYNISLDYLILYYLYYFITYKKFNLTNRIIEIIAYKCLNKYKNNIRSLNNIEISYSSIISLTRNTTLLDSFDELKTIKKIKKQDQDSEKINIIKKLVSIIHKIYINKNFFEKYYEEYIYKNDIYGLGIIFKILYIKMKNKNKNINELINNMILFNPKKRFNIDECIEFCKKKMIF